MKSQIFHYHDHTTKTLWMNCFVSDYTCCVLALNEYLQKRREWQNFCPATDCQNYGWWLNSCILVTYRLMKVWINLNKGLNLKVISYS